MSKSPVSTNIEYEKQGKQWGTLSVPYSYNLSGWSQLQIPVAQIANGEGPTVLLMAGNHGDEYPGQVAIMKLMRELKVEDICGRVIMIPAINMPASKASTRLSPVDGVNLNRAFPGNPDGSLTEVIAHYVTTELFPQVEYVIDLHTGGRGVYFSPCAHLHLVDDLEQRRRMARGAMSYNTDFIFLYADIAGTGLLPVEAENQGKIVITTEMSGGEVTTQPVHQLSQTGLRNVLVHIGLVNGKQQSREDLGLPPQRWVQALDREDYVFAPESGIYEALVDIGQDVEAGQSLGAIHFIERPDREPTLIEAKSKGILIAHRGPTLTQQGDIVVCLAHDVPSDVIATF